MEILNCSYNSGCLPLSWKEANIVPIPKQKLILEVNKHLRPISLTPNISKLAEDFVVERYVKPAVMRKIDQHQYGTVPKHRVITHRDVTDVPTFFVRMLGKLLEFTWSSLAPNTQSKMADRLLNLPSMRC